MTAMTTANGWALVGLTVGQVAERLGLALEEIAVLLDEQAAADSGAVARHLRRQRAEVLSRLDEIHDLVTAIDQALEKEVSGMKLTKEEQRALFGDGFSDEYADEAEQRSLLFLGQLHA